MIKSHLELLKEAIFQAGYEFRVDYSGRGMYGAKCLAIDCDSPVKCLVDIFKALRAMDRVGQRHDTPSFAVTTILEYLGTGKVDSMGMGQILYFPTIEIEATDHNSAMESQDDE